MSIVISRRKSFRKDPRRMHHQVWGFCLRCGNPMMLPKTLPHKKWCGDSTKKTGCSYIVAQENRKKWVKEHPERNKELKRNWQRKMILKDPKSYYKKMMEWYTKKYNECL